MIEIPIVEKGSFESFVRKEKSGQKIITKDGELLYKEKVHTRRMGGKDKYTQILYSSIPDEGYSDGESAITDSKLYANNICIYCGTNMVINDNLTRPDYFYEEDGGHYLGKTIIEKENIRECPKCGWWSFYTFYDYYAHPGEGSEGKDYKTYEYLNLGIVKKYSIDRSDIPLEQLRTWLSKNPNHVAHTNPHVFEKLMADCFKDVYGATEVVHVGNKSGDNGVDIKIVLNDVDTTLVQIKRRENIDKPESVKTIRELNGVLLKSGISSGMVVTTAKRFTKGAIREATITEELKNVPHFEKYKVDLRPFDDVAELLQVKKGGSNRLYVNCSEVLNNIRENQKHYKP